jgi:hypothetical protein
MHGHTGGAFAEIQLRRDQGVINRPVSGHQTTLDDGEILGFARRAKLSFQPQHR